MRTPPMLRPLMVLLLAAVCLMATAQTRYWTGGDGSWNDPLHWSATPDGDGGAGVPRAGEDVVIAPSMASSILIADVAWCRDLLVDGGNASVIIRGSAEMNIAGSWRMSDAVDWRHVGDIRLVVKREGVVLDTRGIMVNGDVFLDGGGSWSMNSDLQLAGHGRLHLKKGTLMLNNVALKAGELILSRTSGRMLAGDGIVMLGKSPERSLLERHVVPGNSTLVVGGILQEWNIPVTPAAAMDVNVCGTGPGQTPFTVNAQLVSNYNGFGVSCRGLCNGTVSVTVSGGVGPFNYQWLNNGPPSATWTTACGGPQIVIVTDIGQGISCPASVTVTEPAPLGVIFFGQGTPPACANVCDGSRTALAVGGVSPHSYNWNNGAGTSSSFFELCAGTNTLTITDANACTFDTTFFFNIQPIIPNLSFEGTSCYGECDGTAQVAPTGGTGSLNITWSPPPPTGQGTSSAGGLCAGEWSVFIQDANGCDTTVVFTIATPPPIIADISSVDATCDGACDGSAFLALSGLAGPFSFNWSPVPGGGQGTANATGLCAGEYMVLITDQPSGCDTLISVIINAPDGIDAQPVITNALCATSCDGGVILQPTGGTPPFTYVWSPAPPAGQGTPNVTGLCPGPWQVTVSDAASCDTTITITITAPPPIGPGLSVIDMTCHGICDGAAAAAVSGGVGDYAYLWTPAPPMGQGTASAGGLCAGEYSLLITDGNGCDTTITFQISEPPPLTATSSQTNASCTGDCDGTASVTAAGGTPGYGYTWTPEPGSGQGTAAAGGLCPGPWQVLVTDANGCSAQVTITIQDPTPVVASIQTTPAGCPGFCDGTAAVVAGGGAGGYGYLWVPLPGAGQGTASATGLCEGPGTVTITDALGCDTTITFNILAPPPIVADALVNDPSCADLCDGSIQLTTTGGSGLFTYAWTPAPPTGAGTAAVSGLCAGSWQVTITSGSCDTTLTFELLSPPPIFASLEIDNGNCAGECTGTATVTSTGGTGVHAYTWSPVPPAGQGTATAEGLCAGAWQVTVADEAGCDTTLVFMIEAPPPIQAQFTTTDETCDGPCTGTAVVVITGGTGMYTLDWQPGPGSGQGTTSVGGLCSNTLYTLFILDDNGCDTTFAFTIDPFPSIDPGITFTEVTCPDACDATITMAPSGGIVPYSYMYSPAPAAGQGTANATGFCAGIVEVTITDATGCVHLATIEITGPEPLEDNAIVLDALCADACSGSIEVFPSGGTAPYSVYWSPVPQDGQLSTIATGLCMGSYLVQIIDANNCDRIFEHEVFKPDHLYITLASTPSKCNECMGTATADVTGGTPGYTLQWTDQQGNVIGSDETVTELCAGLYVLNVTDANGCTESAAVPVVDPQGEELAPLHGTTTCPESCDGTAGISFTCSDPPCTIAWSDGLGVDLGQGGTSVGALCGGVYFASVTNGSGCVSIAQVNIVTPEPLEATVTITDSGCAGECDGAAVIALVGGSIPFTITWDPAPAVGQGTASASGMCAGTYAVEIIDGTSCITLLEVVVGQPDTLVVDATIGSISCQGSCDGTITPMISGGVGPYTYIWSPAVPQAPDGTITGLCAGNYDLTVQDASGCIATGNFSITAPDLLQLIGISTATSCPDCEGTASVVVVGGTAPFNHLWMYQGVEVGTTETLTGLCGGLYSATVTDENGCTATVLIVVPDDNAPEIEPVHGVVGCSNDCDGTVGVNFTCTLPPCTTIWTNMQGDVIAQDVLQLQDLCVGSYMVQVINGNGCTSVATASVEPFTEFLVGVSSTSATCADACDGTAILTASGGIDPYTFTWDPAPAIGQGTGVVAGLCAGDHTVFIADASGCDTTVTITIAEPEPLQIQALVDEPGCGGLCDGGMTTIVSGGTGSYMYDWSPEPPTGQGTAAISGLCAGTYTLTITDDNGCSLVQEWILEEPESLVLTGVATPSECGQCIGGVDVIVSGGSDPYNYMWMSGGVVVGTDAQLNGLCAGIYVVTVTDAAGCEASVMVPLSDLDGEVLTMTDGTTSCPGACDGTVATAFTCGLPECEVEWFDLMGNPLLQGQLMMDQLCAGIYYVMVTNASGCVSIDAALVEDPEPIIAGLVITEISCFDECDGSATVSPAGGTGGYQYNWQPGTFIGQGTPTVTGLCAGSYTVTITDDAGCSITVPVILDPPAILTAEIISSPVTCSGSCDGMIEVIPAGGTPGYFINWSPVPPDGQGIFLATELCSGSWTFALSDASGCTNNYLVTLQEPPVLILDLQLSHNLCAGECSGTATAVVSGGVQAYTYVWTGPSGVFGGNVPSVTGLCAGSYALTVTDANGCIIVEEFIIDEGTPITITLSHTNESCNGPCDGAAEVVATGGVGDLVHLWQPAPQTGQGTPQAAGLCAGSHVITVTDDNGCEAFETFEVLPFEEITATAQLEHPECAAECDGSITVSATGGSGTLSYTWVPEPPTGQGSAAVSGLCPGEYTVTIVDHADCEAVLLYVITGPEPIVIDLDVTPATCSTIADGTIIMQLSGGAGGYTISWTGPDGFTSPDQDITGLSAGPYQVEVTDQLGCMASLTVELEALLPVEADAGADMEICPGVTTMLSGIMSTGADTFTWTNAAGEEIGTTADVEVGPLEPGFHTFTLSVAGGGCIDQDVVTVLVLDPPFANAGPDQTIFASGTAMLGGSPTGPAGSIYEWTPDTLLTNATGPNPVADPAQSTWYYVLVTAPDGCQSMDSVLITVIPDIVIPSGFTPNGDAHNEIWEIDFIHLFPECEVEVYSRWGELLFRSVGYRQPWDGRFKGGPVPVGTYYYVINLNNTEFPEPFTGPLTIIR